MQLVPVLATLPSEAGGGSRPIRALHSSIVSLRSLAQHPPSRHQGPGPISGLLRICALTRGGKKGLADGVPSKQAQRTFLLQRYLVSWHESPLQATSGISLRQTQVRLWQSRCSSKNGLFGTCFVDVFWHGARRGVLQSGSAKHSWAVLRIRSITGVVGWEVLRSVSAKRGCHSGAFGVNTRNAGCQQFG